MAILIIIGIVAFIIYVNSGSSNKKKNSPPRVVALQEFALRLQQITIGSGEGTVKAYEVQAIGLFPVRQPTSVKMVISVLDATDVANYRPVLSSWDNFQESATVAYQDTTELGTLKPDYGLVEWTRVGVVIPEILTTAYSGRRQLKVVARMADKQRQPKIELGFCDGKSPGLLFTQVLGFVHEAKEVGYVEKQERSDQAAVLTVRLAMAVALADGTFQDAEGERIKAWATKRISSITDGDRSAKVKEEVNQAMRLCFEQPKVTMDGISQTATKLKGLGKTHCYEAVELCFDVLAADGVADQTELVAVEEIARLLGIDPDEHKRMKDQRIIKLDTSYLAEENVEKLLGIESGWTVTQKRTHLSREFQKWNGRLNQLPEGLERENAQRMLDRIAKARIALNEK